MLKIIFSILSVGFGVYCFVPYIIDIFRKTTKPHMYSWFIWSILQGSAAVIMFSDGAELGVASIALGSVLCMFIFFLSFTYGTKNIKKFDVVCLVGALVAIVVWVFTKNSLLSVVLLSVIDFVGFLPTLRKSYEEPSTETSMTYALSALSVFCAIISLGEYSVTTVLYLASLFITNSTCALIIIFRRKKV